MPSTKFIAHERAVMDACLLHEETNRQSPEYRRCIPFLIHTTKYHVKFGDSWCFLAEAVTQREIGRVAERDPSSAPRVPIVYHIFQDDEQRTYAITEFVETINVEKDIFITKVATAVLWLRRQPAPPGVVLGPLGSGFAWHSIFKRKHAPLPFTSVEALERLLNQAVSYMQRQQPGLDKIRIADDPLVLTQSDMDSSNFAVDPMGRPVILDFGEIGWLPASLANFTLLETSGFARDVSVYVFGDRLKSVVASSNLDSLYAVKVCLATASRSNLGLDKDGNPATLHGKGGRHPGSDKSPILSQVQVGMATYVFDSGEWDHEEVVGPASKAPANIRALRTTLLRVEWLDLSRPSEKQYSKNHMVFTAVLETPIVIGIKRCFAARLSMEVDYNVGPDDKVPGVEKILICGDDYAPGTYTLALLGYDTPTNIACHHRSYNLKEGMTLGGLIDPIISREMHKFVFLIYTNEKNRFKGCGHHLIRVFTVYIDLGIIPDENSLENPNKSLAEELVSTYVRDRGIKTTHARVGRGRFLEWDDAEHRLVDDDMWSYAPPLHQQRLANAGQV